MIASPPYALFVAAGLSYRSLLSVNLITLLHYLLLHTPVTIEITSVITSLVIVVVHYKASPMCRPTVAMCTWRW